MNASSDIKANFKRSGGRGLGLKAILKGMGVWDFTVDFFLESSLGVVLVDDDWWFII